MERHTWLDETTLRVETYRSGFFTFQIGLDMPSLMPLFDRVADAQERFSKLSLWHISAQLEKEVIAASVFGTNTIEGGDLSEEETSAVLQLSPEQIQQEVERRIINIRNAYDFAKKLAEGIRSTSTTYRFDPSHAKIIHSLISANLTEEHNPPGEYRDNIKGQPTFVGDAAHGGQYRPQKCIDDVEMLMQALALWINSPTVLSLPSVIRASLLHLYFELIHPFWNGNGRTGRVLEALVLQSSHFIYAPFAMANYYLEHIHEYFALFNQARKAALNKEDTPNQKFVLFFLKGMLQVINKLHDRVSNMISILLFNFRLTMARQNKQINERQYAIAHELMTQLTPITKDDLIKKPWYRVLYSKLSAKTAQRDLAKLIEEGYLMEHEGVLVTRF